LIALQLQARWGRTLEETHSQVLVGGDFDGDGGEWTLVERQVTFKNVNSRVRKSLNDLLLAALIADLAAVITAQVRSTENSTLVTRFPASAIEPIGSSYIYNHKLNGLCVTLVMEIITNTSITASLATEYTFIEQPAT
jgi:hypothetical protein